MTDPHGHLINCAHLVYHGDVIPYGLLIDRSDEANNECHVTQCQQ